MSRTIAGISQRRNYDVAAIIWRHRQSKRTGCKDEEIRNYYLLTSGKFWVISPEKRDVDQQSKKGALNEIECFDINNRLCGDRSDKSTAPSHKRYRQNGKNLSSCLKYSLKYAESVSFHSETLLVLCVNIYASL